MKPPTIRCGYDYGVGQEPPQQKPGMFGSWRECAIKLMLAVLVMACLGAMAVYAVSNLVRG